MKIRKMVVALLVGAILLPSMSFAQTTTTLSPTRDELVMKLIAGLMEQIKVLQAQLAALKEKEAAEQATTSTTKVATLPKKGTVTSVDVNSTWLDAIPNSSTAKLTAVPVLSFDLVGKGDTFDLKTLKLEFDVDGTAKITNAYLYQGETTPVASAVVSKNVATFDVADNIPGASFATNIPTRYTVKVDIEGLSIQTKTLTKCPAGDPIYNGYRPVSYGQLNNGSLSFFSPTSLSTKLIGSGITLTDSNEVPAKISGEVTTDIQITRFKDSNNLCWTYSQTEA